MKTRSLLILGCSLVLAAHSAFSTFAADDEGWRPLFNGKDLTGWVPVQVAPNTFTVSDGMIISTGVPTGVMRTDRQYENFELELEWKHIVPGGNAGLFVWSYPITAVGQPFTKSIEIQILDGRNTESYTSHGDIFSIHGARMKPDRPHPNGSERCLPSERRCKPAGEWNHYRVVCKDGVVKLSVNGKEVSGGSQCTPRKGYICLEAEGTECHFRNIRIKELPSTNPKPEEIAPIADGFVSIYNGLNLDGWEATSKHAKHWQAKDWLLAYDGDSDMDKAYLRSVKTYRDYVLMFDWRLPGKDKVPRDVGVLLRGEEAPMNFVSSSPNGQWNRAVITVRGDTASMELNGKPFSSKTLTGLAAEGPVGLQQRKFPIEFANIYIKELK